MSVGVLRGEAHQLEHAGEKQVTQQRMFKQDRRRNII